MAFEGLTDTVRRPADAVAELIRTEDLDDVDPKGSSGGAVSSDLLSTLDYYETEDEYDIEDYRIIYENGPPIVSEPIDIFANKVVEPGWFITADSDDTAEELTEFLEQVAIVDGQPGQDFSALMEKAVIEREVRGTVFIEKVTNSNGQYNALYPLQNSTITAYVREGKAILATPDDTNVQPSPDDPDDLLQESRVPKTENGDTAAFVQFDDLRPMWEDRNEVAYTRDQIIHWPRKADIGAIRGTSRLAGVMKRVDGLMQKMRDNDEAVRAKAWPMIIFAMGSDENPWNEDEVQDFIDSYAEDELGPGMMQAVSGDIDVEEFAGETADISDTLEHDVNMVTSGMPGPKYAIGAFASEVSPPVAQAQEREFMKEVRRTRRAIENKFTPFLKDVAEQYDLDAPDSVELNVRRPDGEVPPEDVRGNHVHYSSESPQGQAGQQQTGGQGNVNSGQGQSQTQNNNQENMISNWNSEVEELADPRLVSTNDNKDTLSDIVETTLTDARSRMIDALETQIDDRPPMNTDTFINSARSNAFKVFSDAGLEMRARDPMMGVVDDTLTTIGQDNHSPTIDVDFSTRHRQDARMYATNVNNQVRDMINEMIDDLESRVRRASQQGQSISDLRSSFASHYSESDLANRADIIALMEVQNAINSTKLSEYQRNDGVAGIRLINPCNENTTPLCNDIACDDHAEAMFDDEQSISDQIQAQTSTDLLFEGFSPLPPVPPYHFGCRTEITAIPTDE